MPGLAALDALLARMGEAGLAVKLRVEGARAPLPAGIDLSAYRIVQEALTNVLKHAGAATAQVVIGYGEREISIEVTDDGRRAPRAAVDPLGTGHGLTGVRERVALLGGDFEVGQQARGGFRVAARLLVDSAPDLEVVGEAADGAEAVELVRRQRPDVVLMDIRMPAMDGLEATRRIGALDETAGARILILTTFDLDEYVYRALRAGASGFVLKDIPPTDLLAYETGLVVPGAS